MKRVFILFLLLMCFLTKIVYATEPGGGGDWLPPDVPPGGGGPVPTSRIDPPITLPTSEPVPTSDDPGVGNKYMYHCKYHTCNDPSDPAQEFLCSPAAADTEVGSCWREIVPDWTDIRERCFYNPGNYDTYNCFESSNLCQEFCDAWPSEPAPGDDTEVVYCKPGCRTCETFRNTDGTVGTVEECKKMFYMLYSYYYSNPREWCKKWYCPTRCGYNQGCIEICADTCVQEFALNNPANAIDLWRNTYTCLPLEKGHTMCAYMCDPKNLGAAVEISVRVCHQ